jgi:hypothetical protein
MAAKWHEAVESEGGDIRHPPRSICCLIKREDERTEAENVQKQAAKQETKAAPLQATSSFS